ncbi:hypothetical protein CHLNCDRAFT_24776 [Chlorella variabilis]|uniref:Glutaredoxin domain-containing protein n=1 Tax=Chlorella variabilis TaxID=554065 RepID=E1ZIB3_CHLVA|nr:hypothetical protein CHLNCDRAFT_24776 [Chlorella variabilis]EFN54126.1 hypothetical protein CHLNCDRAFT_24776 [Chlorella variabilis]|eukprot:XP_005846228.1 hypothetical protein CHLNCDRAFT_24776 [Chlorella variabilis]
MAARRHSPRPPPLLAVLACVPGAEGGTARVAETLKGLPIALFGRSTCPYCIEAQSTLESAAAGLANSPVSVVWYDKLPQGGAAWDALKAETGQKTVPYVFVNGEFLGGCDDIKRLEVRG